MMALTWCIGLRTRGCWHLLVFSKRNFRLRRPGEDMISFSVKHSLLSHSMKSPRVERGINTSAETSCCPWTWHRTRSSSPSRCSMESTVRALPAPSVTLSKVILERLVKVKGRQVSRPTGLMLIISSTVLNGISSGTTLNKPERQQQVSVVSYETNSAQIVLVYSSDRPVWLMGSSNFSLLLRSSRQTDSSSRPMTFMRSPVEKLTSLPDISYTEPERESNKIKCTE